MGLKEGEIEYNLKKFCNIITPDGPKEWTHAILREPTTQHAKYYLKIETMIGKAMVDGQRLNPDVEEDVVETSGEDAKLLHEVDAAEYEKTVLEKYVPGLRMLLINSDRVETSQFLQVFSKLALMKSDNAIIICNDSYPLKESYWENLHLSDQMGIAYLWSAFFVMPSLQ